ncbi:MAG: 4Fe-4S dicluster domain-containing protein [Clostridiales bacterium]|nr:4Fe-4S dicluster domain-containing protein [Clostridiales bacterium]
MNQARLREKVAVTSFKVDSHSHLAIKDPEVCRQCEGKWCTLFCPTGVFSWNEVDQKIDITHEACVECGASRIGCPYLNIHWEYPRGGFGVQHRYG